MPLFQQEKVEDYARLEKAAMQDRSVRRWKQFNTFMRHTTKEEQGFLTGCTGLDDGPWSPVDFPVTPVKFRAFLWWMANPSSKKELHSDPQSSFDKYIRTFGPRGYSYTYMRQITYSFLSLLEDIEHVAVEKGIFAGNVEALRTLNETEMKGIAL